ncbi:MAG: serine/threonine-protein kinase [Deltaproteobacteria bacterium]|jgi:serine/threonine-protein kinase|nr:serine/threonine-protein kinase [Deltaproteobacteria bacterium]
MDTLVGRSINEYRVVEHLGAGGMGDVYRAVHARLGRTVALKVLKHMDSDRAALDRFMNEARIQAALSHPNIAVLYELCETGGFPCIIMEFVDGETLSERIRTKGRFPIPDTLPIFTRIVDAVGYIHECGIIHRDIKPNNVKVNSRGEVKLLDFGISKASFSANLTRQGTFIGTEQYLSPEQLQGKPATVQSDIWALGALLYEMATGKAAFDATSWGELYRKITDVCYVAPSVLVPSIPGRLEVIIERCLKKNPSHRYPSAMALLEDMEAIVRSNDQLVGKRSIFTGPFSSSVLLKKYWLAVPVLLLLAAGAGFIYSMYSGPSSVSFPSAIQPSPRVFPAAARPLVTPEPAKRRVRGPLCTISIGVINSGPAKLYLAYEGKRTGPYAVPYSFSVPAGSRVQYLLKLSGYQNKKGSFDVQEDEVFTFTLCKQGEFCRQNN